MWRYKVHCLRALSSAEMTFSGRLVKADEAKEIGLVLEVVEPDDLHGQLVVLHELRELLDVECDITFGTERAGSPADPDMGLFDLLASAVRTMDPGVIPIPYMSPAITDARWFSMLGIACYGFTPMRLPSDFAFEAAIHGADERIPIAALRAGSNAYLDVFQRYGRVTGA